MSHRNVARRFGLITRPPLVAATGAGVLVLTTVLAGVKFGTAAGVGSVALFACFTLLFHARSGSSWLSPLLPKRFRYEASTWDEVLSSTSSLLWVLALLFSSGLTLIAMSSLVTHWIAS